MPKIPGPPPLPPDEPFRLADTPPTGTLIGLPRPTPVNEPPARPADSDSDDPGPREIARLIRGLRQDLVLLRDSLPQLLAQLQAPLPTLPTPLPPAERSRRQKALVGLVGVSAATGITAILTLLGGIAAKRWPAYADLITGVVQAFGGGGP